MRRLRALARYFDKGRRRDLAAAMAARDRLDWSEAERFYRNILVRDPDQPKIQMQLARVLKSAGRLEEAEQALRAAILLAPNEPETYFQLGQLFKLQSRSEDAVDAFAASIARDAGANRARRELIAHGARHRLPESAYGRSAATASLGRISGALQSGLDELQEFLVVSAYPAEAYDAFRRAYPIQPPPADAGSTGDVTVRIDALGATPALVRTSLISLLDQVDRSWRGVVFVSEAAAAHAVASFACVDERLAFVTPGSAPPLGLDADAPLIMLSAGTLLNPHAVGWLRYALSRTSAAAVTCDHDRYTEHWRRGMVHLDPVLRPVPDREEIASSLAAPAILIVKGAVSLLAPVDDEPADEARRRVLQRAISAPGGVAHLPRILASIPPDEVSPTRIDPARTEPLAATIRVIIPTRDQAGPLAACVKSLTLRAARPERLEFVIVDNRSVESRTRRLLRRLSARPGIAILTVDEPFNWSRLNNLAASLDGEPDILVFANNDVEMLVEGWDERLRQSFADDEIGIVGAKLLYPNLTVQHAGVILGGDDGRPVHEGVGAPDAEPGPLGRWSHRRTAAAVTGAFLVTSRTAFFEAGGFDPSLAIAYNDIDFCLKVRATGRRVLYDGALKLLHHESLTRGLNDTSAKIAWDDSELRDLYRRWGGALLKDPGVNPQWSSAAGRPFEGFQDPSLHRVLESLDASAHNPWKVSQAKTSTEDQT